MKKMVSMLQPFSLQQNIIVYENGNKLDYVTVNTDKVPETVLELSKKYNCLQLDLFGPKKYAEGIGNMISELEITKYNKSKILLNYM